VNNAVQQGFVAKNGVIFGDRPKAIDPHLQQEYKVLIGVCTHEPVLGSSRRIADGGLDTNWEHSDSGAVTVRRPAANGLRQHADCI
jgi:hypothetical protein